MRIPVYPLLATCLLINACKPQPDQKKSPPLSGSLHADASPDYPHLKKRSAALLQSYRTNMSGLRLQLLESFIADSLILPWYGTTWDFNGTTEKPGKGSIACGYFVTTVLRDAGISLNRVKLSQCASSQMIHSLCDPQSIRTYSRKPLAELIRAIKKSGEGLYITGLDFHTGFLWYDGQKVWFIHASFMKPKEVIKEEADKSSILIASAFRMTGRVRFN